MPAQNNLLAPFLPPSQLTRARLEDGREQIHGVDLLARAQALADWLAQQRVAVVGLLADNSIDWLVADFACQLAGVVSVPLPPFFSTEQLEHCLQAAGVELLLSGNAGRAALPPHWSCQPLATVAGLAALAAWRLPLTAAPDNLPPGTQKITFTSGSTGGPKGVCLSQAHQWRVAAALAEAVALDRPRHLSLLPLAVLLENLAGVYAPLLRGGHLIVPSAAERGLAQSSRLDHQALAQCIRHWQPHSLILIPQLLAALVALCQGGWAAPDSLRYVAVGGGKVAPGLILAARAYGLPIFEGYGLSECASVVALNRPGRDRVGSVGQVLPHCQVSIEQGEIWVRDNGFLGYLGRPETWHPTRVATGDLGSLDVDGFLRVDGRKSQLLITSFGRNVSPEWVEASIANPALLHASVVVGEARPHLAALIAPTEGVVAADVDAWLATRNALLPDYAQVRAWRRLDPAVLARFTTATGKLQRERLVSHLGDDIEALFSQSRSL